MVRILTCRGSIWQDCSHPSRTSGHEASGCRGEYRRAFPPPSSLHLPPLHSESVSVSPSDEIRKKEPSLRDKLIERLATLQRDECTATTTGTNRQIRHSGSYTSTASSTSDIRAQQKQTLTEIASTVNCFFVYHYAHRLRQPQSRWKKAKL